MKCASLAWHTLKAALNRATEDDDRMKTIPSDAVRPRRRRTERLRRDPRADHRRSCRTPRRPTRSSRAIVEAISTVFDPEIPVNIWELGLIYDIVVDAAASPA